MDRKASVNVLLAVAVVALGLMAFIGFSDNAIGAVQVGGSPTVSYPSVSDNVAYTIHSGIASQGTQAQMMTQDLLQLELEMHCPGAVKPEVVKLCQKYFVSTS
jgi:hypothetical protein